jgi:hypothetical protein
MIAEMEPPKHGSFSMISELADCGVAYAFNRLSRRDKVAPQPPAWWNVGGTAFHRCAETIERTILVHGALRDESTTEALWLGHFNAVIAETEAEHPTVARDRWRAADKGKENYDWWRVQGPEMVKRYIAYHAPLRDTNKILVLPDGRPALELKLTLDLTGWPFEAVIDQSGRRHTA